MMLKTSDEFGIDEDLSEDQSEDESTDPVMAETGGSEQPVQEETVSNKSAMQALMVLLKHCNHGDNGSPEINAALHKYLDIVTTNYHNSKTQVDIRSYFVKK